ncbi:PKD domain-containing protein [Spirosoma litoris]
MTKLSFYRFWGLLLQITPIILFSTCQQKDPPPKPVAFFTYYPTTNLVAPITLYFSNESENATSYKWETSEGESSTAEEVKLTVRTGKTITITLTATGEGGSDTYSQTITVTDPVTTNPTPTADFTYSPSQNLVAPVTVSFSNTSTNATSYKWDFGDGTSSTTSNPTKQFTTEGTFTVKLSATGSGGTTNTSKTLVIGKAAATTGQAVFWTDKSSGWGSIDVTVGGTFVGTILRYYTSAPSCGSDLTIARTPGTYAYSAKSNTGITWSGNITITANGCVSQKLPFPTTSTNACDWSTYTNSQSLAVEHKATSACSDGISVKVTNKTNIKLVVYIAIEEIGGKWHMETGFPGSGEAFSSFDCKVTGKYNYWAMSSEVFIKNNCPNPVP